MAKELHNIENIWGLLKRLKDVRITGPTQGRSHPDQPGKGGPCAHPKDSRP